MASSPSPAMSVLSPSDRIMWRIERDAVLRSPILVVALLDREPDWDAVHKTFERALTRVPRLHQRVKPAGRKLVWSDDSDFRLDYHLRRVGVAGRTDLRAVLDLAEPWVTAALDTARPLWEFTLVTGLDGGRAAFVLKFHHTITDGIGGIDLAEKIFDVDRHGGPRAETLELVAETARPSASRLVTAVTTAARLATDPRGTARGAARFARSLHRLFAPAPEPLSPAWRGRGLDRRIDALELPLGRLQDAAHAIGVTVNDLFLAAIGGGLHDFHQRLGHNVPALRITMPISLRRPGDPEGGNRFAPARFILPIDDPKPVQRAHIAHAIAKGWRDEPALATTDLLAAVLDKLPAGALTPLFGAMLKNVDVDAVDVPGLQAGAYLGGAHIDRMWAFAPPTGAAVSITLLSHEDTACIGVLSDRAAVDAHELLVTCLETALHEVADLAGHQAAHQEVS